MKFETYYRLLLHNMKGELVKDSGLISVQSYVLQFLQSLEGIFDGISKTAKDINNTDQKITGVSLACSNDLRADAGVGIDTHGIVVGTNAGATAEANDNYKLDTKILHGSVVAGKLNYQAVTLVAPSEIAGNIDFSVSRPLINDSGGDITVKEIGIIVDSMAVSPNHYYFLIMRDVVADFAVTNGFTLTVVYTLRTTV